MPWVEIEVGKTVYTVQLDQCTIEQDNTGGSIIGPQGKWLLSRSVVRQVKADIDNGKVMQRSWLEAGYDAENAVWRILPPGWFFAVPKPLFGFPKGPPLRYKASSFIPK